MYGPDGDPVLDVSGVDVQNYGYWDCSRTNRELGQLKTQRTIGIAAKYPVPPSISAELEPKVLTPCHTLVSNELDQHLGHLALDESVVLKSIPFLPHVDDFDVTILNCPHQTLVHVVVDLIRIEVWVVQLKTSN